MNVLIAGTGSIGLRHITNIQKMSDDIDFVFLRRGAKQDKLSKELKAKVIASVAEIIDYNIDCAIIATPSALHTGLILALIEMGIPMYVEKPAVTTTQDVLRVREQLRMCEYQQTTLTGCNLRFLPSLIQLKGMLESGLIGNVARATFEVGQWLPDWRPQQDYTQSYSAKPELGGGVILDLIHELDAARWLLGEFQDIQAMTSACPSLDIRSEAVACMIMKGEGTPLVSVNLDYVSRQSMRRYEFLGDKGTLVWDLMEKSLILKTKNETKLIDCGDDAFDVSQTYKSAMQAFFHAVKDNKVLSQNISDGLKSVELALNIKEVAKQ